MDALTLLDGQIDRNTKLIENVGSGDLTRSTPCKEFDVRALLNHLVLANRFFLAVAEGRQLDEGAGAPPDLLGDDPAGAYRASAAQLLERLRTPGALDRTFDFGFAQMPGPDAIGLMVMESVIHGWDVAKATGQDTTIDASLATTLLEGAQALDGVRNPEGNPFGPAVQVRDDASPGDRLIALSGRTP